MEAVEGACLQRTWDSSSQQELKSEAGPVDEI